MFKPVRTSTIFLLGMLLGMMPCLAYAGDYVTNKDLQVAVRTFGFIYGMPAKGDIVIEVVYDPAIQASAQDADQIRKIIGTGALFGSHILSVRLVPATEMGTTHTKIAYITHGLAPDYDIIQQKATALKMLTFSTDFSCVESQKCVMGVTADPIISIEISRSATAASELEFSQALKLMIREVE